MLKTALQTVMIICLVSGGSALIYWGMTANRQQHPDNSATILLSGTEVRMLLYGSFHDGLTDWDDGVQKQILDNIIRRHSRKRKRVLIRIVPTRTPDPSGEQRVLDRIKRYLTASGTAYIIRDERPVSDTGPSPAFTIKEE